jgi:hypothetical protein
MPQNWLILENGEHAMCLCCAECAGCRPIEAGVTKFVRGGNRLALAGLGLEAARLVRRRLQGDAGSHR